MKRNQPILQTNSKAAKQLCLLKNVLLRRSVVLVGNGSNKYFKTEIFGN